MNRPYNPDLSESATKLEKAFILLKNHWVLYFELTSTQEMLYFNLNEYWEPSVIEDHGDSLVQIPGTSRESGNRDSLTIIPPMLNIFLIVYYIVFYTYFIKLFLSLDAHPDNLL